MGATQGRAGESAAVSRFHCLAQGIDQGDRGREHPGKQRLEKRVMGAAKNDLVQVPAAVIQVVEGAAIRQGQGAEVVERVIVVTQGALRRGGLLQPCHPIAQGSLRGCGLPERCRASPSNSFSTV